MAVNLQTIKEIRNYLARELEPVYSGLELGSIINIVVTSVLKKDRIDILREAGENITPYQAEWIISVCNELRTGKPVQYVLGETFFYGCLIKVDQSVLIPRQETEELVDLIIKENRGYTGKILDIGTGSGCIAIALAVNLPDSEITAIDSSEQALETASENAKLNNVEVNFLKGDVMNPGTVYVPESGLIVSNPPYVLESQKQQMHRNILEFEPHEALFVPDEDPLKYYRAILQIADQVLNPSGSIYFEINELMGKSLCHLMETHSYKNIMILKDINGKERFIKGNKNDR